MPRGPASTQSIVPAIRQMGRGNPFSAEEIEKLTGKPHTQVVRSLRALAEKGMLKKVMMGVFVWVNEGDPVPPPPPKAPKPEVRKVTVAIPKDEAVVLEEYASRHQKRLSEFIRDYAVGLASSLVERQNQQERRIGGNGTRV